MMDVETSEELYSTSNCKEQEKILFEPYVEFSKLLEDRVKHFSQILRAFNHWTKIPEDKLDIIVTATKMQYQSVVLTDTFKDDFILNKQVPTVHSVHGIANTINAANYATCVAMEKCLTLQSPEVFLEVARQNMEIYKSLSVEYEWSDGFSCPSEEDYKKLCARKMGSFFKMAAHAMQNFSDNKVNLDELCHTLGAFFGIYEDVVNLLPKEGSFGKEYCDCIRSKKFSFPIIHALNQRDSNVLVQIFQQKTNDIKSNQYLLSILEKAGSFQYTKKTLVNLKNEAVKKIKTLDGHPYLSCILHDMLLELNIN